jgi:thiol-disulfide isomerase/thioredoxin
VKRESSFRQFLKYTFYCFLVVGALAVLQEWLRPRHFIYRFSGSPNEKGAEQAPLSFPTDVSLTRVLLGKQVQFGETISFSDLLKRSAPGIIVNFWATWCPPCIEELPSLEMYFRQAKKNPQLPQLVLISVDEGLQPLRELFSSLDFKPSFEVYLDRGGKLAEKMGSTKFPETYYVSAANSVLYKWIGPQEWLSAEVLEKLRVGTAGQPKSQNGLK